MGFSGGDSFEKLAESLQKKMEQEKTPFYQKNKKPFASEKVSQAFGAFLDTMGVF